MIGAAWAEYRREYEQAELLVKALTLALAFTWAQLFLHARALDRLAAA